MEHVTDQEQENKYLRERMQQLEAELQRVREREERGQVLLQLTSDYAYMYRLLPDDSIRREWTTEAFTTITGFEPEEFDQRGWEYLQHPDDRWMLQPRIEAMRQGQRDTRVWRVLTKSGGVRWLQDTCHAICDDPRGSELRVYGIVRDITERKQAELLRFQMEQRLSVTFESIADAVIIYDHEGRLKQYNNAARELLGFDRCSEYTLLSLEERAQAMHIKNVQGGSLALDQVPLYRILRGETLQGTTAEDVWIMTLADRQLAVSVSGAPIYDAMGDLIGAVLVCRDVTARRTQQWRTTKALETLLSMAEALVHLPLSDARPSHTSRRETAQEILHLTCDLLGCQMASMVDLDPETGLIQPIAGVGLPPELREQFWDIVPTIRLSDYVNAPDLVRLQRGEPVLFNLAQAPSKVAPTFGIEQVLGRRSVYITS
ncbi:PAS domain-containing protein [Dictyobacter kobayashii]|uniref:histidine kinase n=1 Tax=Dictyobacter kobayashii TaxID=2014872 RepID=A0A402APR2_9CHLR|nr:PAS domain S-box protein [Dictyobacter kobayashii]GCE21106.1 hypothetical protein KDK_49060 [Dictyobacter kobayashii]